MKKGFTLVELLAVVIILGVLALIAFPIIDKSIKQSKEKALDRTIKSIIDASYEYSIANDLGYNSNYKKLEFETLINAGLLKEVMINPITDKELEGCVLYRWVDEYKQYEFEYSETCEIPVLTIEDIVLSNFPYLEVGENGCKNPSDDNYSYMGGCYLKGSNLTGKEKFYSVMFILGREEEAISQNFFDSNGDFKDEEFEKWIITQLDWTEEEKNKFLQEAGVDTIFKFIMLQVLKKPITPEELFSKQPINNSLWYSGFLWRIMGINADGSVRLITDENLTSISWGEEGTAKNWDESYVKDWLNNYFYSKLKGNNIIVEQTWCSEATTDEYSSRTTCTNNLSKEKAKVGLLTLDEYNLADGLMSYLNIGRYHQTMTPQGDNAIWGTIEYKYGYGSPYLSYTDSTFGIRAVINIDPISIVTGGNGSLGENWNSEEGPYILNEDKNDDKSGKLSEQSTSGEFVLFAGKKYRVVDKDSNGNTKLILESYYEEPKNTRFEMKYGDTNEFTINSGIGKKLNTDVLNWLIPTSDIKNRNKIVTNYTWYQNVFDYYDSYKVSLNEENPTRTVQATVGLIRIGEILSGPINTLGYLNSSIEETLEAANWTMTIYKDTSSAWFIHDLGAIQSSSNNDVTNDALFNGLRPVIVIKSDVEIIEGTGTYSNPYKI